jgi:Uma2 family endonuclease
MAAQTNPIASNPLTLLNVTKVSRRRLYTLGEYLQREQRAKEQHEYHNGIIQKLPMGKGSHNIIVLNVARLLMNALDSSDKTYTFFGSQQLVYFPMLNSAVYPDVLAVAEIPEYFDDNEILLTNPLLIVEVLSKSTRKYDYFQKFEQYKTLPSFCEYVLIDPEQCLIETRFKEAPNLWRDTTYTDLDGDLALRSVDCAVPIQQIYQKITFK